MKKLIIFIIIALLAGTIYLFRNNIKEYLISVAIGRNKEVTIGEKNKYYRDYDFQFVQNTDNFTPQSQQDIYNIFYTVINAGKDEFTFFCPKEYENCTKEIQNLANDQTTLSDINNYVHPYNSFSNIETAYDTYGKITITIEKIYSEEDINQINQKVDELSKKLINTNDTEYNNIKRIHDYIIDTTKYDSDRSENNIINYKSDTAYGPLFEGYAICGGYTDLMQLFLEKMNIKSYRVSSDEHVWNAVNYNNTWLNLDLTWDDPVTNDGSNYLDHKFFLIDTKTLLSIEKNEHDFDINHYKELA